MFSAISTILKYHLILIQPEDKVSVAGDQLAGQNF
jgi:hypothetical protein